MGEWVPASLKRAGRIADGWISYSVADLTRIDEAIAFVHEGAEGAGKDPTTVEIVVRGLVQLTAQGFVHRARLILPTGNHLRPIRDTDVFLDFPWVAVPHHPR